MKPDEIRKLLGGYATGTLTDRERDLLFSAALQDQTLFDALANEEALRELLADPQTRQLLLGELRRRTESVGASPWQWLWNQLTPRRLAVAAGLAVVVLVVGGIQYARRNTPTEQSFELALSKAPESAAAARQVPIAPQAEQTESTGGSSAAPSPQRPIPRQGGVPIADERRDAGRLADGREIASAGNQAAEPEPKAEKESPTAPAPRQEADRAARSQGASSTVTVEGNTAPAAPAPARPAATLEQAETKSAANQNAQASAPSTGKVQSAQGFRQTAPSALALAIPDRLKEMDAKVTDVNGTIVSVSVGTNAGLKVAEILEIVRDNRVIGTIKLTAAGETYAVGPFQPTSSGRDTPRAGDAVRRPVGSRP